MKNQIDQTTPFLAFYDLLRICGIYSDEEKREKLRRGFRRAMALAAVVLALALPQRTSADSVLATRFGAQTATIPGGTAYDLDGGTLMTTGDNFTINGGATIFKNTSTTLGWTIDGGTLTSPAWVYFFSPKGISFDGGTIDVAGLVAAGMSSFEFGTSGTQYKPSDVTGAITVGGTEITAAAANQFFIGTTVSGAPSGATVLETSGISALDTGSDVTFSVDGSGTIRFVNAKVASGNVQTGSDISGDITQEGGTISAANITDKLTQSGGTATVSGNIASLEQTAAAAASTAASAATVGTVVQAGAGTITVSSKVTGTTIQNGGTINASLFEQGVTQTGGTIDAGSGTATLSVGTGSTLGSGTVNAGTISVGSGTGELKLTGNNLSDKTVNAGTVTLAGSGTAFTLNNANISILQSGTDTSGNIIAAGAVNVNNVGALNLNAISASSLTITAGGAVSQNAAAEVTGATSVKVADGSNVTLNNAGNKFNSVGVVGKTENTGAAGAVTIVDNDGALELDATRASSLTVTATGDGSNVTISDGKTITANELGIEAGTIPSLDGGKLSGVTALALRAKTGDVTLNNIPASVAQNLGVVAEKGNVEITSSTANQTVTFADVTVAAGDVTVEANGLEATEGNVTVNLTGNGAALNTDTITAGGAVDVDVANGTASLTTVNAGGAVDVDAATADVAAVNAGGAVHVEATTGDATVGTAQGASVEVVADNANAVVRDSVTATAGNATVTAANGTVNGGNVSANGGIATVSGRSANVGNVTATRANNAGGNASVTATAGGVQAGNVTANGGAATVTAPGNIVAASITGSAGTTVNKTAANGAINVNGNIGQGGTTTINANGASITAGTLGGGNLVVNNAAAVDADIDVGGDATIQATSLTAGNTVVDGDANLDIGGDADVGNLDIGGDLNGTVGGAFTTAGGTAGSIGQNGGFEAGSVAINGNLGAGPVTMNAPGGFTGNGILASGNLTLNGGNIGSSEEAPLRLQTADGATINLTGGNIYMEEVGSGRWMQIGNINASGVLSISAPNIGGGNGMQGGFINGSIHSGGNMTLDIGGQFGAQEYTLNPVSATIENGRLIITYGKLVLKNLDPSFIHVALNVPGGTTLVTPEEGDRAGFIIYQYNGGGFQVAGASAEQTRLINRALEFTLNTPELKSKQGIFGDPAFVHTKMNVSEARSMGNMDMLELNDVDYSRTWRDLDRPASARVIEAWSPAVDMTEGGPVDRKLGAVKSEAEQQPEVRAFERVTAPTAD